MKKNFPRLAALCLAATVLLTAPACEEAAPEVQISVSPAEMTVPTSGGECTFTYTLSGTDGDILPEFSCPAEWVSDITVAEPGLVRFTVSANPLSEMRETAITLTCQSATAVVTVTQDGITYPAAEDIAGTWNVIGDRWDLDEGKSACYLMDDESEDGFARDENGDYITITVREYCEEYAKDYNADPKNEIKGTPEDFAEKIYEMLGLSGTFTVTDKHIKFDWGLDVGFYSTYIDGDYTYDPGTGIMTVDDRAIPSSPRELPVNVFTDEEGRMNFRFSEYYIVGMTSYDGSREYWIYAPTIFFCEPAE